MSGGKMARSVVCGTNSNRITLEFGMISFGIRLI